MPTRGSPGVALSHGRATLVDVEGSTLTERVRMFAERTTLLLPNGFELEILPFGEGPLKGRAIEVTLFSAANEVIPMFGGSGISHAHKVVTNAAELGLICAEATDHAAAFDA